MPVLQLTTRRAVEWGANLLLDKQQISPERKQEIRRVTEFNLLTTAFNGSTVLLVAAFAAAVFFAYTAAATLGAIGLFLRYATEKEIAKYTLPAQGAVLAGEDDRITNIFFNVGLPRQEGWEPISVIFDEFAIWRSKIEVSPALAV